MNAIPELLLPLSPSHQDHRRPGVDVKTALHAKSKTLVMMDVDHTSAAGMDGIPSGVRRGEGLAEYAAQDADDGEELDRTNEVTTIQRAARRHFFKENLEQSTDALTRGRNRLFKLCKASANGVHAKYRKVYLGPVPHLLLCVEWIVTRAQESKDAIKARRRRVGATLKEKSDLIIQHKLMR